MLVMLILTAALQVHEWGVITSDPLALTGDPLTSAGEMMELEDRAPVLYFHGEPCTVTIRIDFPGMGYATELLPAPHIGGVNSTYSVWEDVVLSDQQPSEEVTTGWPGWTQKAYPVPLWRQVEALDLVIDGYADRFLYYECVPGSPGDLPYISQSGNISIRMPYGEIPCVVLKTTEAGTMYGVFTLADVLHDVPKGLRFLEDPEELRGVIMRWSEGLLFQDEFDSFWSTWESSFLDSCSAGIMLIYPVPGEVLESIADIQVKADNGDEAVISRFVVALLPWNGE